MSDLHVHWPNWIGVVVEDMAAQRSFYRDVLGLTEVGAGDGWVQFDMGFPNLLELLQRSERPEYDRPRYQVGFATDDIRTARSAMLARGVEAVSELQGGPDAGGYWCYFRDAERNVFELSQRIGAGWK
jgi:catechol 2,3-dioxygenase-like lactoylglutathione lyase family enzyme